MDPEPQHSAGLGAAPPGVSSLAEAAEWDDRQIGTLGIVAVGAPGFDLEGIGGEP